MLGQTVAGESITPQSSLALLDVFAAVRRLSDGVSSMPLIVYRKRGEARERAQGPTADLLQRPAPATTQASLIGTAVAHLATHGNCYVGKIKAPEGQVVQLVALSPERVVPEIRAGVPLYTYGDLQGVRHELTPADVIHARTMSTDGLVGLSPIRQARESLGLAGALTEHASAFWANGAAPGGLLRVPAGPAAEEVAENLAQAWGARHGGPRNRNRIAVLTGEASFEAVSLSMEDAAWVESQRLSTVAVARLFGLPPWVLAADAGSSLTYSNVTESLRALVWQGLRPYMTAIEQSFSLDEDLCPEGSGLFCELLADSMLRSTPEQRADVYQKGITAGWLEINDVRRMENLPPLERPTTEAPSAERPTTTPTAEETPRA